MSQKYLFRADKPVWVHLGLVAHMSDTADKDLGPSAEPVNLDFREGFVFLCGVFPPESSCSTVRLVPKAETVVGRLLHNLYESVHGPGLHGNWLRWRNHNLFLLWLALTRGDVDLIKVVTNSEPTQHPGQGLDILYAEQFMCQQEERTIWNLLIVSWRPNFRRHGSSQPKIPLPLSSEGEGEGHYCCPAAAA